MGKKSAEFEAVRDTFISLADLSLEMERQRAEEKAGYARRWMPDADTTDADSRNRKKAEEIVDRAIEAMGGMDRLLQVRDMHTKIEIYAPDPNTFLWRPAGERLFYQGRKFMENLPRGRTHGYDGKRAWAYRYGISRSTHTDLLKQQAERWDFISRFKGEGIVLHYLGKITLAGEESAHAITGESARVILGESVHVIQVDDRKYGFLREAYFSPSSHLLIAEKQHGVLTRVEEYRTVDGIKTPYEVRRYFRRSATRYRFNTRFNTGLESSFFDDPGERTWDSNSMVALLGVQADSTMRVALNEITQILTTPRDVVIDYESRRLLDAYLGKKLKSAGVLGDASSRYNVEVTVKGYYRDPRGPTYTINFHLVVADKESTKPLLDHIVSHRWKSILFPPIDQSIAERLTSMLVKSIGHALSSKNRG